jgi:hypothetical protein
LRCKDNNKFSNYANLSQKKYNFVA